MSSRSKPTASPRKRILIVEDHPLMREGVATWIDHDPDLETCGEAGSAAEALSSVEKLKPDLVLCDITLSGNSGIELVKELKALHPDLPVVMLSMHDESLYALGAVRAGARGYVMKKAGGAEVITAIKHVLAGHTSFSPSVADQLLTQLTGHARSRTSPSTALTDRELQVLRLLGEGKTNRQIADQLRLSPKTIDVHRANIRHKLRIKSTPELIRYAVHYGSGSNPDRPAP